MLISGEKEIVDNGDDIDELEKQINSIVGSKENILPLPPIIVK